MKRGRSSHGPQRLAGKGGSKRSRSLVVPGYTRTAGAYARASGYSGEKKYLDANSGAVASYTVTKQAGTIIPSFNLIAQGASANERIGTKVNLTNINAAITFRNQNDAPSSGHQASGVARVIWYVDTQCNGAAALVTDILEAARYDSYRNMNQAERFVVLKDKTVALTPSLAGKSTTLAAAPQQRIVKFSWKGNRTLTFKNDATAVITNVKSENIGLLIISEVDDDLAYTYSARIKFTE
jgi:hypothetical protein